MSMGARRGQVGVLLDDEPPWNPRRVAGSDRGDPWGGDRPASCRKTMLRVNSRPVTIEEPIQIISPMDGPGPRQAGRTENGQSAPAGDVREARSRGDIPRPSERLHGVCARESARFDDPGDGDR